MTLLGRWTRSLFGGPVLPGLRNTLRGGYDLRGDRLVGWIDGNPMPGDGALTVEVRRFGELLAACTAVPDVAAGKQNFELPINNRFDTGELVRETVLITAKNERGDTGVLTLDGVTQLGLIRENLAAPAVMIFDLDFTIGGNAKPYMGGGWSTMEKEFTWSDGYDSFIVFDTPRERGSYALRIVAGAFIRPPSVKSQIRATFLDDREIEETELVEPQVQFTEMKLGANPFSTKPQTTLRFHYPYPVRPCDLLGTNGDLRRLAFCVKRLTMVRLLPVDGEEN